MNRIDKIALGMMAVFIIVLGVLVFTFKTYIDENKKTQEFIKELQDRPIQLDVRYIHEK